MENSEGNRGVYLLFGFVTVGAALGGLSQTGMNAMLTSAMGEFGLDVDAGQWLTTAYMLVLGVAVPVATYLSRRVSDRAFLIISFALFAAGSLVDWLAPGFAAVLLGRVLQATSVGLLTPLLQTIAMTRFPPGRQGTAMGIAGIAMGFAPNVGPTVGGAMDFAFGWRSFFLLLFAISALLLMLALPLVKATSSADRTASFETVSFVFSTLGFGGVLLGLSQASSYGMASPWFWAPIVVGAVFLALFARRQTRIENPLIDLRIFKSRTFVDGLMATVFLFACFMGVTLVIPLYVQGVLGGTALDAGLVIFPTTFTALLVNPLAGWLTDKTSARLVAIVFGTFLAVGSVACVFVGDATPLWMLSALQTIRAIGVSGLIGPLITFALSGLRGPLVAHGSSAAAIIRQVAGTFGTAIMVLCVTASTSAGATGALPYQVAFGFAAIMAVLCLGTIVARVR